VREAPVARGQTNLLFEGARPDIHARSYAHGLAVPPRTRAIVRNTHSDEAATTDEPASRGARCPRSWHTRTFVRARPRRGVANARDCQEHRRRRRGGHGPTCITRCSMPAVL